ncbi:type IV toxin-antitoxin system AbiEi family antitoxin [Blastococcus sp. SYSU D00695]
MARPPFRPADLTGKVFRGSAALASAQLTRGQLRSSAWRRLFPDVYACSSLPIDHRVRARVAALLLLPGAVLSGRSAAVLWGADLAGPDDDVECAVDAACRAGAVRGVRLTRRALAGADVTTWAGVRVTTPLRTALDLARVEPADEAVVCLDRFLQQTRRVGLDELRAAAAALTGPGCRRVRAAVARADGLAESPQETRTRLCLHASGLPRPTAQYRVLDASGTFVARVDLAWPEARVAVEYEGTWHGRPQQVGRDRRRLNALTAAGWTVVFVTAEDLADPVAFIARVAAALTAAGCAPRRSPTLR